MTNEEWAFEICKLLKRGKDTQDYILHDLNNLRAGEWLDELIDAGCTESMLSMFMKEQGIPDSDLYLKVGDDVYVNALWSCNPSFDEEATGVIGIYVYDEEGNENETIEGGELDVFDDAPLIDHIEDILNFIGLPEAEYKIISECKYDEIFEEEPVYRVLFGRDEDREEAEELLDDKLLDYDYDSGDRMMVGQEALDELYEAGIDFDEI